MPIKSVSLVLSPAARALFERAREMKALQVVISNNVEYAVHQELGTKRMPAHPMVGAEIEGEGEAATLKLQPRFEDEYGEIVRGELADAIARNPLDPQKGVEEGLNLAAQYILANVVNRTAVDTGRLKGAWQATLVGGRTIHGGAGQVTAEDARIIRLANAKKRRAEARKAREAAKRAAP